MSPYKFYQYDGIGGRITVVLGGILAVNVIGYNNYSIRPSIVLASSVTIESDSLGTQEKPYVIK